jgi:hypothetical protein
MQLIKKAKALNIAATSTVTSKTEFLKVNIVFSKLNPEPAQGINRELNVQGHGRHRRISSPYLWIVVSSSITDSRELNHQPPRTPIGTPPLRVGKHWWKAVNAPLTASRFPSTTRPTCNVLKHNAKLTCRQKQSVAQRNGAFGGQVKCHVRCL